MEQEIMKKVMDEVMKRIGSGSVIAPEKASQQQKDEDKVASVCTQNMVGVTEYVGISEGDTIGPDLWVFFRAGRELGPR